MHRIEKDALFVIDGSYLLYRSFYAIRPLYNSAGIPTQATFGFCRAIKKLVDTYQPSAMTVVWDSRGKTFRSNVYADYKATRQKPPSELFVQKEYIVKFLDAIGMAQLAQEGYEADDVIATLAQKYPNRQIVLVCPDKDMYQLLSDKLLIFDPFKDRIIDRQTYTLEQSFGPEKVPFYYALLGDASDNIPGVTGIGKKTAQDLVMQFQSLDDLYANLDKVAKERTKTLLAQQKENAFLSLKLFTLNPPSMDIKTAELAFDKNKWGQAAPIFQELEFTSMLKDIAKQSTLPIQVQQPQFTETNRSLFDQPFDQPIAEITHERTWDLVTVQDNKTLEALIKLIAEKKLCALDTETTGVLPLIDRLVGISFAVDTKTAYYIPLAHENITHQLDLAETIDKLKPILEDAGIDIIMHNAKFDQLVLWNNGVAIHPLRFDTLLAANLVRNEWQKINLKDLSMLYLQEPMHKFKEILGKHKTFAQVPIEIGAEYGAHDALQTLKIAPLIEKQLDDNPTLKKLFFQIEMPFYWVLVRMEQLGISIDSHKLEAIGKEVDAELSTFEAKIMGALEGKEIFTQNFNINSPKQIERLLFDELKLPVIKKSDKGQRSTNQEVLIELSALHPIPGLILRYRELAKLKNTYIDPLPSFINPKDKRIHTSYSQSMVATGRLSSSDPNLQNIPAAEGFGMEIRSTFIASEGKIFMSADYSQIELRVLAHLSQDPTLIDIFVHDRDIHTETASQLFDVPLESVTNQQRQLGKRINFSIIYGMSPFGLARDLGIKQSDAKTYIEKYFARYPKVAEWMDKTVQKAIVDGYVETLYGRRRHVPELREKNRAIFEAGKRIAVNSPVQGTQADIMKTAMIRIDNNFIANNLKARMILQIHDEIVIELAPDEREAVEKIVAKGMESVVDWETPLKVTIRTGENWAQITK